MKILITLLLTASLAITNALAQNINGIATYKTDRKVDLKMDSTQMGSDMQAQIAAQLRKQFQREYTLTFSSEASIYKEVESLESPTQVPSNGINIRVSGGSDILYRNTKEGIFVNQTEIMDKPFLIKDSLQKYEWKLEKGTKNIGNYTCFKASYIREVSEQTFDSSTDSLVEVKKERVTTAWYTLDIPVTHGPDEFFGLPGLILELNDGDFTILCSKIVINPEKGTEIIIPSKGKEVTQEEYDEIQDKKSKEMMERFQSDGRRGNGNRMQIRIGG